MVPEQTCEDICKPALPAREEHVVDQKMADLALYRISPDKPSFIYVKSTHLARS